MGLGISYKQEAPGGGYDAIVVGSGIGGLTAAAVLARQGRRRVLVLERHYTAGGFTHTFTRPGYEWDVGVHYIGDAGPRSAMRPAWDYLTDGKLEWEPLPEVYDRVHLGDRTYDYVTGVRAFADRMKGYFPGEAAAIDRYLERVRDAARAATPFFLERALRPSLGALAGPLMRRSLLRDASRTTAEVLGEITRDRELAAVLTAQWGDYGLPPAQSSFAMHAAVARHYLRGAWYPRGGAGSIARAIAPAIEDAGGAIYVGAEVARVLLEGDRAVGVVMADGRELRAPIVISDAGALNTWERLLPPDHSPDELRDGLRAVGASFGHLCLYLGLQATAAELGLDGTNLWIYPDSDHDGNLARYLADPEAPLPLTYVSFPSAKDPSFRDRFPGRATVEVIVPARYEWFERWEGARWRRRGDDYDALKARFRERILAVLFAHRPSLRGRVDVAELSTPLSTRHFANYGRGELYGLDHSPARYRLPLRARTPVRGLFLTGQDLVTCGVTGALLGGIITATAILGPGALYAALARRAR